MAKLTGLRAFCLIASGRFSTNAIMVDIFMMATPTITLKALYLISMSRYASMVSPHCTAG